MFITMMHTFRERDYEDYSGKRSDEDSVEVGG